MSLTLGRHSYHGNIHERFEPVVEVGNFTSIASDVTFYGTCQHPQTLATFPFTDKGWCDESVYPKSFSRGKITIGSDVWIGEHVLILDGITIGDGAIIGTGSVVTKEVLPYAIVGGNPAKLIRFRFPPKKVEKLLELQWWNKPDEEIKEKLPAFTLWEELLNT